MTSLGDETYLGLAKYADKLLDLHQAKNNSYRSNYN